jgi:mannose-6-phosphate isomerase
MDLLRPVIQPYAWGSRHAIAGLQGRTLPSDGPEAELWMGAHPAAPSGLTRAGRNLTLDAVIAADPGRELGVACRDRFGGRLPFLLKILAAEKALSIQVHPDRKQAEAGFAAERGRDGVRAYVDDWPKPELLHALTPFEVLAGFRAPGDAADVLASIELAELNAVTSVLRGSGGPERLTEALRIILTWPEQDRARLLGAVVPACARAAAGTGSHAAAFGAVVRMSADHPGDIGLLASLLFQHRILAPGEALFMPAGGLHAYIAGVGVEVLANSDNVLRAGLTPKHIDIPELLRVINPAAEVPVLPPRPLAGVPGAVVHESPSPEFRLYRFTLTGEQAELLASGPRIALCTSGEALLLDAAGTELRLQRSESCFLSDADGTVTATGEGVVFVATAG